LDYLEEVGIVESMHRTMYDRLIGVGVKEAKMGIFGGYDARK